MTGPVRAVLRRVPAPVRRSARRVAALPRAGRSVRAACGLAAGTPLLVFAGRPGQPDLATAIAALRTLRGFHLAVLADDPEGLVRRAAVADGVAGRVHVLPARRTGTPGFLDSADIGVVGFDPRGMDRPLLPDVAARLKAAGVPVVGTGARPVREYVVERGGVVFAPGDPASLAAAVRRVYKARTAPAKPVEPAVRPGTPRWTPLGPTPIRLGLGTANYAGQLGGFAGAICRARPDVSAEVRMAVLATSYPYPADVHVRSGAERWLGVQLAEAERVLGAYTHVIVDAFRPILGRMNGEDISADLPALAQAQIKVALLAHGSEIRDPDRHLERHPESGFLDADDELRDRLRTVTARNRRIAEDSGLPFFVTTPDLLADVPWATWAPLVVDVDGWACDRPVLESPRPIVLHAPSSRWTKGTDRILPVLEDLHDRNVIDFRLVEGLPWAEMRELVWSADVVIDQLVMGGGVCTFGCEAMAAGKVVVAYLDDDARVRMGEEPPLVNATPNTLHTAIERILDDRSAAAKLASRATDYARDTHDGRRTVAAFADFLR